MSDQNKAEISIGAKIDEAVAAIGELNGRFDAFSKSATAKLDAISAAGEKLVGTVKKIGATFLQVETVLKGVATTKEFAGEVEKLSKIMGIGRDEASHFNVALGDVHSSTDQAVQAVGVLTRQLRGNEEALQRIGIKTRDANGQYKDQKTLLLEAISVVNSYKEGTDRNAAAQVAFGRSALELGPMLKLTAEKMEEARVKAESLGLVMTDQGATAVKEYKSAMNDFQDTVKALWKVVGDAFMPILTNMGKWFANEGPDAVAGFREVLKTLVTVFDTVWLAIQQTLEFLRFLVRGLGVFAAAIAESFSAIASGDFGALKQAWSTTMTSMGDEHAASFKRMEKNYEDYSNRLGQRFNPDDTRSPAKGGGRAFVPVDPNLLAKTEAELAMLRATEERKAALEGDFQRFSLTRERDFWQQKLATLNFSIADRQKILMKIYNLETQIGRDAFAAQLETLKAKAAAYQADLETRLRFAEEEQRLLAKAHGPESPQAKAALKQVEDLKRQIASRAKEIAEIWASTYDEIAQKELESRRSALDQQRQMFQISRLQEIGGLQEILDREYALRQEGLNRRIEATRTATDFDLKAFNDLQAKKLEMDSQYTQKKLELDKEAALESAKYYIQARSAVESQFSGLFQSLLADLRKMDVTLQKIALDFLNSMSSAIEAIIAKRFAERLFGPGGTFGGVIDSVLGAIGLPAPAGGAAGTAGGAAALSAAGTALTGSATSLSAAGVELNVGAMEMSLAGIDLSMAGIELTLAATELTAAAAALAAGGGGEELLAFAAKAAFAAPGGFDVPAGLAPVTQLHPEEMVLPAHLANVVREMAEGGGPAGGGPSINFHGDVYGMDDFRGKVAEALRSASRFGNGNLAAMGRGV